MRQILPHVNKYDFLHRLVFGRENEIIVSCVKNIIVLNVRLGDTHKNSCDASLCKGCFPIHEETLMGSLKLNVLQGTRKA